ncbi:MAG: hypothetical protein A3J80_11460, partial [Desulfobacula sp. RIFOXYB2_FULL_45_6]
MNIEPLKNNNMPATLAIWCITPKGKALGLKLKETMPESVLFIANGAGDGVDYGKTVSGINNLGLEIKNRFNQYSGHVFIFSVGIAVRLIAPVLKSKMTDPAVVVVDDTGNHAVSLISGHIGGANALTKKIAAILHAHPVITTATDANGLPAIDLIAQQKGLYIETPENIKRINMAFLMGKSIYVHDPFGLIETELQGISLSGKPSEGKGLEKIFCSHEIKPVSRETMVLRPPVLSVGIGCNRGTRAEEIYDFLTHVFYDGYLSMYSIDRLSSIDLKKNEKGLLILAEKLNLPLEFYSREKLNSVESIQ